MIEQATPVAVALATQELITGGGRSRWRRGVEVVMQAVPNTDARRRRTCPFGVPDADDEWSAQRQLLGTG